MTSSGESSMWVVDAATAVDTDELLRATESLRRTIVRVDDIVQRIGLIKGNLDDWLTIYPLPGTGLSNLVQLLGQLLSGMAQVQAAGADQIQWRERAALIYAGAESSTVGLAQACRQVTLSCGLLSERPWWRYLRWVPPLMVPLTVGQAGLNLVRSGLVLTGASPGTGVEGLVLQGQVRRLAQLAPNPTELRLGVFGAARPRPPNRTGSVARGLSWLATVPMGLTDSLWGRERGVLLRGNLEGKNTVALVTSGRIKPVGAIEAARLGTGPIGTWTPRQVGVPLRASQALGHLGTGGEDGQIQILRHDSQGRGTPRRSWTVLIRGTKDWGLAGANPQDMLTNLQEVGGAASDQREAVLGAMELAGIGPAEAVELVGHSQGGIVAANLAADPAVADRFAIRSVLTVGAPVGGAGPPNPGVEVLSLENLSDAVPALDGAPNPVRPGVTTVYFDPDLTPPGSTAHGIETYDRALEALEQDHRAGGAVDHWLENRRRELGLEPTTQTVSLNFWTQRVSSGP